MIEHVNLSNMNKSEIDEQKIIVNRFEENLSKSINQIVPCGNNSFILVTNQDYPNKLYLAELHTEEGKPSLLKGEKRGPALVVKDLLNIEAHKNINLGGVEQSNW